MISDRPASEIPISASSIVRRALRRQRKHVLQTGFLSLVNIGLDSLPLVAVGLIIDHTIATGATFYFIFGLLGFMALYCIIGHCWKMAISISSVITTNETYLIQQEIVRCVLDPRRERNIGRTGEIMSVIVSDAEGTAAITRWVPLFFGVLVNLAILITILFTVDIWLGAGTLAGSLCVAAFMHLMSTSRLVRRNIESQKADARTAGLATDLISGLRILRGIGAHDTAARRYCASSQESLRKTLTSAKMNALHEGAAVILSGVYLAIIVGFSAWRALSGKLSVGELIIVVGAALKIVVSMQGFGSYTRAFANYWGSAVRVAALLNTSRLHKCDSSGYLLPKPEGQAANLVLDGISCRTLTNVSASFYPGEIVGVVSNNLATTDSLIELLAHRISFEEYQDKILIKGTPIRELSLDIVRQTILVEQHNIALFDGTLRMNLLGVQENMPTEYVMAALTAVAAVDVANAHPAGLDQPVIGSGDNFSGGQIQRIGLARALLANPPILVLAEPTTAVDAATEELIAEGLIRFRHNENSGDAPTTVIVTNSPTLLGKTNRVIVIGDGEVADHGTHIELMDRNSSYRQAVLR